MKTNKILLLAFISVFVFTGTGFSQWTLINSGTTQTLRSIYQMNSDLVFAVGDNGTFIITTNGGQTWNSYPTGLSENLNSVSFLNPNRGVACGNSGKIIQTFNGGLNWSTVSSGVKDDLKAISFFIVRGVCTGSSGTILHSSWAGEEWKIAQTGFFNVFYGTEMFDETIAYVCGVNSIFQPFVGKSTDAGANWSFTNFYLNGNEGGLLDIDFISENEGFASAFVFDGQGAVSYTSNGGANWSSQLFPSRLNSIDMATNLTGYCAGDNGLIIRTTNKGLTWNTQTTPLSVNLRSIDFTDSLTGFAVGDDGVILKTNTGGVTSINNENSIADKFTLSQNYPNPFNPVTIINYKLQTKDYVLLTVSDITGRNLKTLVSKTLSAGSYSVTFDGGEFSGGVYLYTLKNVGRSVTKKFVLLK